MLWSEKTQVSDSFESDPGGKQLSLHVPELHRQMVVADSGGGSVFHVGRRALQLAIFSIASFCSADELLLFNALALRSGQVLQTLRQEASQEDLKVH